jgi:hypothetical protein
MKWLGFVILVPPNLVSSFAILVAQGSGKRGKHMSGHYLEFVGVVYLKISQ